jgi:hypothetical protein
LRIRFTVSDIDYNGFVEEGDSALKVLFCRGCISKDELDPRMIQYS